MEEVSGIDEKYEVIDISNCKVLEKYTTKGTRRKYLCVMPNERLGLVKFPLSLDRRGARSELGVLLWRSFYLYGLRQERRVD
ncbi:MAG: hypothetical protein A2Y24_02475 [Clostridiales bacterium GWE2_32_10]|nr:MAG: hypothetical protein A2Y24_02475 [Clostridiales bacterium GWE2_32_10]HBY20667.1 hypothetical protein [Clostridiales bacterium]